MITKKAFKTKSATIRNKKQISYQKISNLKESLQDIVLDYTTQTNKDTMVFPI